MPTLAPKLPWLSPFAGVYPRRGGQPLPTDPDAIDYLSRLAEADGASVEVGIAHAIEAFIVGCKADNAGYAGEPTRSNWDAIKASCIMCGARTLSGALVPLKGTAPTPYNFASGDYSRSGATPGLKGDGATKYIDTNRAGNADGQDDAHVSCYLSTYDTASPTTDRAYMGVGGNSTGAKNLLRNRDAQGTAGSRVNCATLHESGFNNDVGFFGASRASASTHSVKSASEYDQNSGKVSDGSDALNVHVFGLNWATNTLRSNARIAFYSVGAAIDLAALDERVTTLVSQIAAAIP